MLRAAAGTGIPVDGPSLAEVQRAFPQLEILECIGRGGMGIVYKANQAHLGRCVALKLLDPGLQSNPGFAERFAREARILGKLAHPNIVAIHDFGETDGYFWLMMEYVDGVNLRQAMQAGRFSPAQALAIIPEICTALQFAHDQGVLHRDIKPENILLDATGHVKIVDFGIARLSGDKSDFSLTRTGSMLGTTAYSAPEQIENPQDVDHRADIYSLGVVFYEMLTGELPLGRFAAPSEKSASDPGLDEVVFRALAKEREKRYQSADEVKSGVTGVGQSVRPIKAPPVSGMPWSAKLPLILFFAGIISLFAFTTSTEPFIAQYYWRKLWDPLSRSGISIGLESAVYQQFLNLWFGSGLLSLLGGAGLGLWNLFQIKRGKLPAAGWVHLRRFILWPCLLAFTARTVLLAWSDEPLWIEQDWLLYSHWIVSIMSFLVSCALFWIGSGPAGVARPTVRHRTVVALLSVVVMISASFVTKRLDDHWTDDLLPIELGWNLSPMNEASRNDFTDAIKKTATEFPAEVHPGRDGKDIEVRFTIPKQPIYYQAYQNAFLLRLRANSPGDIWSMGEYNTEIWWKNKVAMSSQTIFVLIASVVAGLMAAWCWACFSRLPFVACVLIAALFALLPAWPIPKDIASRVLSGPPPAPVKPFIPVFSETTIAVQSVFDGAYLGDEAVVRQGLSRRLLDTLQAPGKFEAAMTHLAKRRWVTNTSGNERVWVRNAGGSAGETRDYPVRIAVEDNRWKLDELPN